MKKILLFEDEILQVRVIRKWLTEAGYTVESVLSLPPDVAAERFQVLLKRADEFNLIIWDAEMSDQMTFSGYIQAFAKVFKKPMIANSSTELRREKQMEAGCTHQVSDKEERSELVDLVKSLLE